MSDKDYIWLNEKSLQFLQKDYLLPNQTVDERVHIIANKAEEILQKPGFANKFVSYMKRGWFSLSTPIWTNFGTTRGLPISCFGSYMEDSMGSILYTMAEIGMMSKYGGGTSVYHGNLRHRGSTITNNGFSSGSVHFMQLGECITDVVSQGATRRGSLSPYLPIEHPDIVEFLNIRHEGHPIQQLNPGITVTDIWLLSMAGTDTLKKMFGDREYKTKFGSFGHFSPDPIKQDIWAKVIESRKNTGYPYIIFIDNANNNAADVYKSLDMKIVASNLCVAGSERVVSNRGITTAQELYVQGGNLELFDGEKKINASPMKLIEKMAHTFTIKTVDGREHTVTSYHKIKTNKGMVAAEELVPGDKIFIQKQEGLFGHREGLEEAFILGLYQSDGTQWNHLRMIDIWENDFDLISEIESDMNKIYAKYGWNSYNNRGRETPRFLSCKVCSGTVKKMRLTSSKLEQLGLVKGIIPESIWCGTKATQAQFLRGLYYADGTVRIGKTAGNPLQLSLASINRKFLQDVQIILSNLGISSKIHMLRQAGMSSLPDGLGGHKEYPTKDCWRLIISNKPDAIKFEELTGFLSRKGVTIDNRNYRDNTKKFSIVSDVVYAGRQDVYCTTVDSNDHVWTCNSFITSNCTEIFLPSNAKESFVCDLSSMNVFYFDEWKNTDAVETLTYLLDSVMTEFIEKAYNIQFMERARKFAERHRALGIGWLGWHSYLQKNMIPFESMEAKYKNIEVAKTIEKQAYLASKQLAVDYGEPKYLKGFGRRNATLCAIAPTKSSSFILGQMSEGIEPIRSNYFVDDKAKGKFTQKNVQLAALLENKGYHTDDVWNSIRDNRGSVQHLDFLSANEKAVFKTFEEISPKEILIQAAARQNYIDQGQSLNLIIHPETDTRDINKLYLFAWFSEIKSLYYQININAAQEQARNVLECVSCT
jgi:ribonucleoside-diphosphate reductase alpha chain